MCYVDEYKKFTNEVKERLVKYGVRPREAEAKAKNCVGMFDGTASAESVDMAVRFCLNRISLLYIPPRLLLQIRDEIGDPDYRINDYIVTVMRGLGKTERSIFFHDLGVSSWNEARKKYGLLSAEQRKQKKAAVG